MSTVLLIFHANGFSLCTLLLSSLRLVWRRLLQSQRDEHAFVIHGCACGKQLSVSDAVSDLLYWHLSVSARCAFDKPFCRVSLHPWTKRSVGELMTLCFSSLGRRLPQLLHQIC